MISALGVLTQHVTIIQQPQDRETPRKPAQVPVLGRLLGQVFAPSGSPLLPLHTARCSNHSCKAAQSKRLCTYLQGSGGQWLPSSPVVTGLPGAGGRAFGVACAPAPGRLGPAGSPAVQVSCICCVRMRPAVNALSFGLEGNLRHTRFETADAMNHTQIP